MTTKYYVHKDGFADNTAYLMVKNNKCTAILKNGKDFGEIIFNSPETCERYVKEGVWKRITAAEAKSLLDKPATPKPVTFTLDARAKDVLLNEIELDSRDLGADFVSLIYRIQEAGIAKGEANAKRIIENALDNI